uniref:non-specific serine/threonine protein kinase n=1 Tax=Cyprinus carpio TaxID=7962 RepID=A0A8C2GZB1_CYPCA
MNFSENLLIIHLNNIKQLCIRTVLQVNHSAVICANNKDVSNQYSLFAEKRTKGRKGCGCLRSVWKSVKHHVQTLKTRACPRVTDPEPSQEPPQTSRAEPTADTDPLESEPVFDYAQATQRRAVASAESSSDVFEDAFEYFPVESSTAQPSSENNPEQQNNPTEKRTKGRKGCGCLRSVWKSVKHHVQTLKTRACPRVPDPEPSQEPPQTSRAEPTADTDPLESQTTDRESPVITALIHSVCFWFYYRALQLDFSLFINMLSHFVFPYEAQHGAEYLRSLYEVGEEVGSGVYEGIRRSDGQRVLIKFVKRHLPGKTPELDEFLRPMCEEAATMLMLQRPPFCDHVIQLYDWFITEEQNVLIMENPHPCVTLRKFIKKTRGHLSEEKARLIMWQVAVALRHCWDRGIFHETDLSNILINTDTLQLKIMDFRYAEHIMKKRSEDAYLEARLRVPAKLQAAENLYFVLDAIIKTIRHPCWKKAHLSRECTDLLGKLGHGGPSAIDTLENILDHAWFRDRATVNEGEGN